VKELAFHFGAPDKLAYASRLLRKAASSGAKVVVVADAQSVAVLDADLWAVSPTDFVTHCTGSADPAVQNRSSVVLVTEVQQAPGAHDVLVNLGDTLPDGFDRFKRLIEVVSTNEADRERARKRWKLYTAQGYAITRHDLALKHTD
jgi:DNA polymerase-3 subunit chi